MEETDPLASALGQVERGRTGGRELKVIQEYGDRPAVLDAIVAMRRDKGLSCDVISAKLYELDGTSISSGALRTFLSRRGVY